MPPMTSVVFSLKSYGVGMHLNNIAVYSTQNSVGTIIPKFLCVGMHINNIAVYST